MHHSLILSLLVLLTVVTLKKFTNLVMFVERSALSQTRDDSYIIINRRVNLERDNADKLQTAIIIST